MSNEIQEETISNTPDGTEQDFASGPSTSEGQRLRTSEGEQLRTVAETLNAMLGAEPLCNRILRIADTVDFAFHRNQALSQDLIRAWKRANQNAAQCERLEIDLLQKIRTIEEREREIDRLLARHTNRGRPPKASSRN